MKMGDGGFSPAYDVSRRAGTVDTQRRAMVVRTRPCGRKSNGV